MTSDARSYRDDAYRIEQRRVQRARLRLANDARRAGNRRPVSPETARRAVASLYPPPYSGAEMEGWEPSES